MGVFDLDLMIVGDILILGEDTAEDEAEDGTDGINMWGDERWLLYKRIIRKKEEKEWKKKKKRKIIKRIIEKKMRRNRKKKRK